MGRGRQKAKQTKVARELKYFSPDTDLNALQRELGGGGSPRWAAEPEPPSDKDDGEEYDPYDDWAPRTR
ncbi:Protein of unknown function [Quadrisphaera granulorum]|uniref:DUF3073 family protein n=1 Tax=Quadrisphaera granulorum TaxID=317664 RepID=A0A315ZQN0_9ACTN|nr:DUF3073 domain-containing protein [Quadrisphaera granulorum]PWJ47836.1 Protein of unknown function (DUF3073) [Quadrisphaera granulorum]SZE98603.1 Protein of unknown function [Quadrisphaera granulorum]